jgi:hypothetical protein
MIAAQFELVSLYFAGETDEYQKLSQDAGI